MWDSDLTLEGEQRGGMRGRDGECEGWRGRDREGGEGEELN